MKSITLLTAALITSLSAYSAEVTVKISTATAKGDGVPVGTVQIVETQFGLVFYPSVTGLQPGVRGFHVHENPSCAPVQLEGIPVPALAAGGHLDPKRTGRHGMPWGDGHLGDLPPLFVLQDGSSTNPVLAPRLKLADIMNRSLMIHAGGDNHADHPAPFGGVRYKLHINYFILGRRCLVCSSIGGRLDLVMFM